MKKSKLIAFVLVLGVILFSCNKFWEPLSRYHASAIINGSLFAQTYIPDTMIVEEFEHYYCLEQNSNADWKRLEKGYNAFRLDFCLLGDTPFKLKERFEIKKSKGLINDPERNLISFVSLYLRNESIRDLDGWIQIDSLTDNYAVGSFEFKGISNGEIMCIQNGFFRFPITYKKSK